MVRSLGPADFGTILAIVNDGATAYRGIIPADRLGDPYMSPEELRREIAAGVTFHGFESDGGLAGVMGIQEVQDVTLIRHAYMRMDRQGRGVGSELLQHIAGVIDRPVLMGTWAAAFWAIRFYEKHGFRLVSAVEKDRLLRKYWTIPERQIDTS